MSNAVEDALWSWAEAHKTAQEAASTALSTAFPHLVRLPLMTNGCCPIQWNFDLTEHGGGTGSLHLDDESRVTIEITDMDSRAIADALDSVFRPGWFTGSGEPLRQLPGQHTYDDDTGADYEMTLHESGPGNLYAGYLMVPHAIEVLDALAVEVQRLIDGPGHLPTQP